LRDRPIPELDRRHGDARMHRQSRHIEAMTGGDGDRRSEMPGCAGRWQAGVADKDLDFSAMPQSAARGSSAILRQRDFNGPAAASLPPQP